MMLSKDDLHRLDTLTHVLTALNLNGISYLASAQRGQDSVLERINAIVGETGPAQGGGSPQLVHCVEDFRIMVRMYLASIDPAGEFYNINEDNRERLVIQWIHPG